MQTLRTRRERILIVDADTAILETLRSNLQPAGYEVIETTTGNEALSTASAERPDLIIMEPALPDIDGLDVCRRLQEGFTTRQIPVMFLASRHGTDNVLDAFSAGAYEYMTKPFTPAGLVSKVHAYFRRARRDKDANPLTGLPGGSQITAELNGVIAEQRTFAFLWADLSFFKAFNDYYGFLRGDQAILLLARTIEEAVQFMGNHDDILGHIGGDDFIVITTPEKARAVCTRIIANFDEAIPSLYDEVDARRGYIEAESRQGNLVRYPLMTVSIGVVTNERRRIDSYLKASSIAAEVLRHAKSLPGSSYYFDQRENGVSLKHPSVPPVQKAIAEREKAQATRRGDFVSLIAHELRTPVTAMQVSLEDLMGNLPTGMEAHQKEVLELVHRRAKRLAATVSDLTTYDCVERGDVGLTLYPVDMPQLVEAVLQDFRWLAEDKGISLNVTTAGDLAPVMADRERLAQVLGYLVENALKFTSPGGAVTLNVRSGEADYRIEVNDTGIGIPQKELATIFRSFCQVERPATRKEPGLGLGLYLAKKILLAMGGHMEVESQEGDGSKFTAVLPKKWRSTGTRLRSLQDAASTTLNGVQSQLQVLMYDLNSKLGICPATDESIEALKSGISELDLIANQALLLAEQASRQSDRRMESALTLRAEMLTFLESLIAIIEKHLPHTLGVSRRIARHAVAIAKELGVTKKEQDTLYCAALLHDLGMVSVPNEILTKAGPLTEDEWKMIRNHPRVTSEMLAHVRLLSPVLPVILAHHERYDGKGYPKGIRGWGVPRAARILAVAAAYDAMISSRPYRQAMTSQDAKEVIASEAGGSFDPQVVKAFLRLWEVGEVDWP